MATPTTSASGSARSTRRCATDRAKLRFGLSPRQLEVLDFAAQTCRGATISVSAKAAGRIGTASGGLAVPGDC